MKFVYVCLLLFVTSAASASSTIEVMGGSLVYHPEDQGALEQRYQNKTTPGSTLISPLLAGARLTWIDDITYTALSGFGGHDSFGKNIMGGAFSVGRLFSVFEFGLLAGAYGRSFHPGIDSSGEPTVVPMMGLEFNIKAPLGKSVAFKVNTMASFQLVTGIMGLELAM